MNFAIIGVVVESKNPLSVTTSVTSTFFKPAVASYPPFWKGTVSAGSFVKTIQTTKVKTILTIYWKQ
jgi:hypothetical protein